MAVFKCMPAFFCLNVCHDHCIGDMEERVRVSSKAKHEGKKLRMDRSEVHVIMNKCKDAQYSASHCHLQSPYTSET